MHPRFIDQISHTNCGPPSEVRKVHDSPYNVRHTSPRSPVICVYFSRSTIYTKYQYVCVCVCVTVCVSCCVFVCVGIIWTSCSPSLFLSLLPFSIHCFLPHFPFANIPNNMHPPKSCINLLFQNLILCAELEQF